MKHQENTKISKKDVEKGGSQNRKNIESASWKKKQANKSHHIRIIIPGHVDGATLSMYSYCVIH